MKKKILSMLLAGAMAVTMLAGCGENGNGSGGGTQSANGGGAESGGDPVKIVLETFYFDAQPADLELVEAAINEITIPEINVEVELYPMAFMEASQNVSLMISGNQQLDLIVNPLRTDFLAQVNKNMLIPLDDLYEQYGADIKKNAERVVMGGYVGDELYGIPSIEKYGRKFGLLVKKEVVDAVGWTKFEDLTMDELGDFMAKAKEAYPDQAIAQIAGGGNNIADFEYYYPIDYLGADAACGGIMGIGKDTDDKIVNVFATQEYADYCKKMREWFKAGYFNADCATSTDTQQSAVTAGTAVGYFLNTELDMVPSQSGANGCEMVALNTRGQYLTQNDINAQIWSIPVTCENPEAAMKLMNLMWGNVDLINLLYYGIEGQDYVFMDDDSGRITYVEGQNAQTCGFHQWFGLYGDTTQRLTWDTLDADYHDQLLKYNDAVDESNTSKYLGYSFNPDEMKTTYSAVTDVILTYRTALECGAVDPDEMLPKFIEALEAAGINDMIAKNQENLDAWLAEQ